MIEIAKTHKAKGLKSFAGHSTIAGPLPSRSVNVFANGGDSEEIVTVTMNLQSLNYIQSRRDAKKTIDWKFIAKEYAQLAGI